MEGSPMTCKCIEQVNEQLGPYNTELDTVHTIDWETKKIGTELAIATRRADSSKRTKCKTVLASFCPFCGKSLTDKPTVKRKIKRTPEDKMTVFKNCKGSTQKKGKGKK